MSFGFGIRCSTALAVAGVVLMVTVGPSLAQKFIMKIGFVTNHDSQHESAKMFKAEIENEPTVPSKLRSFRSRNLAEFLVSWRAYSLARRRHSYHRPLSSSA